MATNWITISSSDLIKVISSQLRDKSDENIGDDIKPGQAFDPELPSRADGIIALVIKQFRGAIQKGGKYPLSLTDGTIPPDLEKHVLNMAAFELVNSTQNLQMVIMTEKGAYSPFQTFYEKAEKELEAIRKGAVIIQPTDPTGEDYLTAINVKWCGEGVSPYPAYDDTKPVNRPLEPIRVGGQEFTDLTTGQSIFNNVGRVWPADTIGATVKTDARIIQRVECPACGFQLHVERHHQRPICFCITQGCTQHGVKFYAPVQEIKLEPVEQKHP